MGVCQSQDADELPLFLTLSQEEKEISLPATSPEDAHLPSPIDEEEKINSPIAQDVRNLTTQDSFPEVATAQDFLEQQQRRIFEEELLKLLTPPTSPFQPKIPGPAVQLKPSNLAQPQNHLTRFRQQNKLKIKPSPEGTPPVAPPSLKIHSNVSTPDFATSAISSNCSTPDYDNFFTAFIAPAAGASPSCSMTITDTPHSGRFTEREFNDALVKFSKEENTRYNVLLSEANCSSPAPVVC